MMIKYICINEFVDKVNAFEDFMLKCFIFCSDLFCLGFNLCFLVLIFLIVLASISRI